MIERVAACLIRERWPEGCAQSEAENGRLIIGTAQLEWGRMAARAAIAAMREPTASMSDAGMCRSPTDGVPFIAPFEAEEVWHAMIDEALT